MRKLITTIIIALLPLTACSADYSVPLEGGYFYNHWGNNFISRKVDSVESEVVSSHVKNYAVQNNLVLVSQLPVPEPKDQDKPWPTELRYWILDMGSHSLESFDKKEVFLNRAKALGASEDTIEKVK